jgi:hypothetical protein
MTSRITPGDGNSPDVSQDACTHRQQTKQGLLAAIDSWSQPSVVYTEGTHSATLGSRGAEAYLLADTCSISHPWIWFLTRALLPSTLSSIALLSNYARAVLSPEEQLRVGCLPEVPITMEPGHVPAVGLEQKGIPNPGEVQG